MYELCLSLLLLLLTYLPHPQFISHITSCIVLFAILVFCFKIITLEVHAMAFLPFFDFTWLNFHHFSNNAHSIVVRNIGIDFALRLGLFLSQNDISHFLQNSVIPAKSFFAPFQPINNSELPAIKMCSLICNTLASWNSKCSQLITNT